MNTAEARSNEASGTASVKNVDMKLEVVVLPVSGADRAKEFYGNLGWRLDADVAAGDTRLIQFTPPGSGCSVQFGRNLTPAAPGSAQALHLIVSDIEAAHALGASQVFHCSSGFACRFPGGDGRVSGPDPGRRTYGSFLSFSDPDGNSWVLQEVTTQLPGRVAGETTYASAGDLAQAMRRASAAHGQHEARTGQADPNWPDWYAQYMVREQAGEERPT
jgi:catechol 2,3-dioxygenase-like lactoylglutathione lyase family enzyme